MTKKRPRHRTLAALGALVGCVLYAVSSILDFYDGDHGEIIPGGHRSLQQSESGVAAVVGISNDIGPRRLSKTPPQALAAQGAGPKLTGLDGQIRRFHPDESQGIKFYKLLATSRLQWNAAAYHWNKCPPGEDTYLGNTGFTFRDGMLSKKHLRFRILRRDQRDCMWNFSKSCLGGGGFVMNFGKTAKDMLYPGDYKLKTSHGGAIRIVAYNTNRACSMKMSPDGSSPRLSPDKAPLDFLRHVRQYASDPKACETWINKREEKGDLFSFNSDLATVYVDTPWASIIVQVRQNKVKEKGFCAFAAMNVWVTNLNHSLVAGEVFSGVLGEENHSPSSSGSPIMTVRKLYHGDTEQYEVKGPFGV